MRKRLFWVFVFLSLTGLLKTPEPGFAFSGIPLGGTAIRAGSGPEILLRAALRADGPNPAWKSIEMIPAVFGVSGVIVSPERLRPGLDSVTLGVRTPKGLVFRLYRLKWFVGVVVAKRSIRRGETVRPGDLEIAVRAYCRSFGETPKKTAYFDGKVAKKTIREGEPLTERDVGTRSLVERGDLLTLIARSGGVEARIDGVALEPGGEGDVIRVRIPRYRREARGVVLESGLVLALE
ncbi:MAG: flagellar basal body P-ring formation chaperone FlgA [Synergistales bacterium]